MASLYSFLATHVSVRQTTGGQPGAGPPGGPPGGGIDPSLLPHDDRGGLVLAVIWTFIPLSGIFLGLRLYCRQWKRLQVFWDDIFLIAAWLLLLVDASLTTYVVKLGYGKHAWDVPFENVDAQALIGLICTTLAITSAAWSKTSFALTLLRIAGKRVKIVIYFLIFSMNTLMGVGALLMWVNCKPLRKAWQPMIEGYCWDRQLDVIFGIFSGSKFIKKKQEEEEEGGGGLHMSSVTYPCDSDKSMFASRLFWHLRSGSGPPAMDHHPQAANEDKRKVWHRIGHEHGSICRHLRIHQVLLPSQNGLPRLYM